MQKYEIRAVDGTLYTVSTTMGLDSLIMFFEDGGVVKFNSGIVINMAHVISIKEKKNGIIKIS